ncbi:GT2 family glycosyltransferase [Paraburkholderia unamae]|uniref:GT2 family glycosyltransferase n=2 Tax=Paraburkholderia unamae TaxID=219649 RepID=A0ABX5KKA7_9BURK|nr:GT2 family glycosyltransferase [Paraburkholderia unamae]
MKTLQQLYDEHHGKLSDKWSIYLTEYDRVLSPYRTRAVSVLEIGIQNGGSLEIWAQAFPDARAVVGCDINPACAALTYTDPRISVVTGDANLDETERLIAAHAERFDIVIDDGSHKSGDIVKSFLRYFARIEDGGVFIAEDLHCSYSKDFDGGLYHPYSSISFFKHLADVINHEHWGIDRRAAALLDGFVREYGVSVSEDVLGMIHSVQFANSLCIIRKATAQKNVLGQRVVVGEDGAVVGAVTALNAQSGASIVPPQTENQWSILERSPAESWQQITDESARLRQRVDEQLSQIDALRNEVIARETQLAAAQQQTVSHDRELAELRRTMERDERKVLDLQKESRQQSSQLTTLRGERKQLASRVDDLKREASAREGQIDVLRLDIHALVNSTSWRLTAPLRWPKMTVIRTRSVVRRATAGAGVSGALRKAYGVYRREGLAGVRQRIKLLGTTGPGAGIQGDYTEWVRRYDQVDDAMRQAIRKRIASFGKSPLISVVMPVYNPKPEWLSEAIESVRNQLYPNWELCIADDVSPDPAIRPLLERYAREDKRIKVVFREKNGHISAASNSALGVATGEWVALLDHDDLLPEYALYCVADAINDNPAAQLIYSDEDKMDESGRRHDPYFKCAWNPDLFYSHNMFSHLGVYKKSLLDEVGGFRVGLEGSQDYDLALRCIERVDVSAIHHIPRVLYHWRVHAESTASGADAKPYAAVAGERALNEHFQRTNVAGVIEYTGLGYRARYELPSAVPLVSLIIPTRNGLHLIRQCIESIVEKTSYENYEIIVVDNGSDDPATLRYFDSLKDDSRIRILRDDRPFNYSALNNAAVEVANGEFIGLINNDIEVISPDWLSEMVGIALQPGVGAVGAKLWYPNDTLQHGGVVLGVLGVAGHAHKNAPRGYPGYFCRASLISSFSAVTAACLIVRKSIYNEVAGLNETDLTVAFNDIDFCIRVLEAGYRNVWTPYAELYHHESATRGFEDNPVKQARFMGEIEYMLGRWGKLLKNDPAYSPNLTLEYDDFGLAWPPRVKPLA